MPIHPNKLQVYESKYLQYTVNTIVSLAQPEKILLLAVFDGSARASSFFIESPVYLPGAEDYFFLVLKSEGDPTPNGILHDKIESCKRIAPLTVLVMRIEEFNEWLAAAHPFAVHIVGSALLCYDAGKVELVVPPPFDGEAASLLLQKDYVFYERLSAEFMVAAELHLLRKQYNLALFNIHQAAEQLYLGLIRALTGLRVNTHNVDKLYRYSRCLGTGLTALFPRDTEEEQQLFSILQKAYIDTRYKKEYTAGEKETSILYERVGELAEIVGNMVRRRMAQHNLS